MARGRRVIVLQVEYVTHDPGLWCNDCLLSTGLRIWYTVTTGDTTGALHEQVFCTDCGGRNIEGSE